MTAALACALALSAIPGHAAGTKIPYETRELANGLKVVLSQDASVPVVALSMIFNVGGRQETRGRSGFAHLFEHLMFEGSKHVPKGGFDRILETYGGDNNASTHEDFTLYYEVIPSNALPIALWLDADRVGNLKVTPEAMKNQIDVVKEERRMRVDNEPYGPLLYVEMASHTFANWQNSHPTIGSFEDLDAANLKDVQTFFDAYYAPRNAVLAIVGDIDVEQSFEWARRYFEWIPNRGEVPVVDTAEPAPSGSRWVHLKDAHAQLPAFAVTWRGLPERRTPDYYALGLLGQALFEGKSSRLYQQLVKRSEVAVSVSGGLGFPVSDVLEYRAPGAFGGFVIHKAEHPSWKLATLVSKSLREIGAKGLAPRELARVKTKFRSDWVNRQQTALGRAERLLVAALLDKDPGAANTELERFMAVTGADLQRVVKRYLNEGAATYFQVAAEGGK